MNWIVGEIQQILEQRMNMGLWKEVVFFADGLVVALLAHITLQTIQKFHQQLFYGH